MSARSDREDYLSLVLHELRNPLVGIDAAARVLSRELGAHPGSLRAWAIASEARHLLGLLETVADAEAAAAGRLRSRPRSIDLATLVRETVAGTHLEGHPISVSAEGPITVRADPERIRQVVVNLLMNAAQYSPGGTPIDVSVMSRGGAARVEIRDRGPGIPASERRKLFQKFTRLTTADGTRGSGLGLYICRAIVTDHGGEIAYARAGGTSNFSFDLPLRRSARAGAVDGGRRRASLPARRKARP